jgi:arylsulfatase A-like enzyme
MLTKKSCELFKQQGESKEPRKPFFLYLPLASPHTPIEVAPEWRGKSGLNPYADFVMQTDAAVGQMMQALDDAGLAANTLVIFTSDNGCSPQAKYEELLARGHNPSGPWRGHKADIFEGGHRIPFIARWPGQVKAGSSCDQTICLTDLWATAADILGAKPSANAAVDSVSILPYLRQEEMVKSLRDATVHHSINGSFAIRQGDWKLCLCKDSGGWSDPKPNSPAAKKLSGPQLFNLKDDPGEKTNVFDKHPQVAEKLTKLLETYIDNGRSTPGAKQENDVEVKWKRDALAREKTS